VQQEAKRADFRAKFPDLCPLLDGMAALYGKQSMKLICAVNIEGEEVGKVDQAFRDAAHSTWNAPPVVDERAPVRRKK
jgi:hypothetical protein